MNDRADYQHMMAERERQAWEALRHAEELGLSADELHLLAYLAGIKYQPKENRNAQAA